MLLFNFFFKNNYQLFLPDIESSSKYLLQILQELLFKIHFQIIQQLVLNI